MAAALDRALSFLNALVAELLASASLRLPTVGELAARAGVAKVTMARALHRLRDAGLLTVSHGTGTRICNGSAVVPAVSSTPGDGREKWRGVARRLASEVATGVYREADLLPSRAELARHFGVDGRTLRKALEQLTSDKILVRVRRQLSTAGRGVAGGTATIGLVMRGDEAGGPADYSPRTREQILQVESVCRDRRIRLWVLTVSEPDRGCYLSGKRIPNPLEAIDAAAVVGSIVWALGLERRTVAWLLERLGRTGKPVSVLDEDGTMHPRLFGRLPASVRFYSIAGSQAPGHAVGRFLLGLGHRRVAYFSCSHNRPWSINRLEGLRRALSSAGPQADLLVYAEG